MNSAWSLPRVGRYISSPESENGDIHIQNRYIQLVTMISPYKTHSGSHAVDADSHAAGIKAHWYAVLIQHLVNCFSDVGIDHRLLLGSTIGSFADQPSALRSARTLNLTQQTDEEEDEQ
jgi:hypothetical protein